MRTSTAGFKQMQKIIMALTAAMALASCSQDQPPSQAAAAAPGISPAAATRAAPATQRATVTASTLSLRATASRTGRRIATLHRDDEVQVLDVTDNWAHVMVGASEGYVEREYLRIFAASRT
jgi:uncharacterized protein YgiM (DUF1202 family)